MIHQLARSGMLLSWSVARAGLAPATMQQLSAMATQCSSTAPAPCGEYDRRTFKGKRFAGTYGLSRRRGTRKPQHKTPSWHVPPPAWRSPGVPPYLLQQYDMMPTQQAAAGSSNSSSQSLVAQPQAD